MKKNRKFAAALALMLVCALLAACGGGANPPASTPAASAPAASAPAEATSGTGANDTQFVVGMECAYAPFNWTQLDDANGAVPIGDGTYAGGYDVEIAKSIAQILGKELVIVKTEWDGLPPSLTSGKIDAIIAGMTNTEERRQTIDFTDNYYTSDLVMVVAKDGPYASATSIQDFAGAKVTGQLATLHYDVIDQIDGVVKEQALKDFPTMVVALSSGKIDAYVSERPGALSAVASNPNLTFVAFEAGSGFDYTTGDVSIAIGVRKDDPDTKAAINEALAAISEEQRATFMENAVKNQPSS